MKTVVSHHQHTTSTVSLLLSLFKIFLTGTEIPEWSFSEKREAILWSSIITSPPVWAAALLQVPSRCLSVSPLTRLQSCLCASWESSCMQTGLRAECYLAERGVVFFWEENDVRQNIWTASVNCQWISGSYCSQSHLAELHQCFFLWKYLEGSHVLDTTQWYKSATCQNHYA